MNKTPNADRKVRVFVAATQQIRLTNVGSLGKLHEMQPELLLSIAAGVLSALLGGVIPSLREFVKIIAQTPKGEKFFEQNAAGRLIFKTAGLKKKVDSPAELFKELSVASEKMDAIVAQIRDFTNGRVQTVSRLESQLGLLSQQEEDLKKRIQDLRDVPLPAAEYFAELVSKGEKRSAVRDYVLFLLGAAITTGVAILLRKLGWG